MLQILVSAFCKDRRWRREASTGSNHLMKHGQKQNTDSVWTGENKNDNNADTGMKQRKAQMCVMMVTGMRNEGQPGALERQRGAGVTDTDK